MGDAIETEMEARSTRNLAESCMMAMYIEQVYAIWKEWREYVVGGREEEDEFWGNAGVDKESSMVGDALVICQATLRLKSVAGNGCATPQKVTQAT
jgi:hypothetical protein